MGKPVDDYDVGEGCSYCFNGAETPDEVYIAFHGTDWDGVYALPQHYLPCTFVADYEGPEQMSVRIQTTQNKVDVLRNYLVEWATTEPGCEQLHGAPPWEVWAYWWWGCHPILEKILVDYNIYNVPGSKYEAYPRDIGDWDFRLANRNGKTNILIKFRPQFYLDN